MNSVFDLITQLENKIVIFLIISIASFVVIRVGYLILKFHNRSILESFKLERSLKIEKKKDTDRITDHINRCISRSTVEFSKNKKVVLLHLPTKIVCEPTSQIEVKKRIREMVESEDFREILNDILPNYRFSSKPKYQKNEFIIVGSKF